jgi:cysteine desulfurase / selenocysteine lyase
MPRRAVEAVARHFAHRDEMACADFLAWFDDADRLRETVAQLIHASGEDIAFVPNASAALSLLIGGLDWKPGDRVVTLAGEFPNNIYYPSMLAAKGVEFVEASWNRLAAAVTPNTRLVAMSTVNYATGFRAPFEEIVPLLRRTCWPCTVTSGCFHPRARASSTCGLNCAQNSCRTQWGGAAISTGAT